MPQSFAPVNGATIERYGPGEQASNLQAGGFILTHGSDLFSRLIRLGQERVEPGKRDKPIQGRERKKRERRLQCLSHLLLSTGLLSSVTDRESKPPICRRGILS